jgi:hypothetical protein
MRRMMINKLQTLNWRLIYLGFAAAVLVLPAVAMPFTNEVVWGAEDFGAAAMLLGGAWAAVEIVVRIVPNQISRAALTVVVILTGLATCAQLAVQF